MTYEAMIGLWQNAERTALRRGFSQLRAVQDGVGAAFGNEIPAEYFSAIYENQDEAEARYSIYQAHCQMNRTATHGEPAN